MLELSDDGFIEWRSWLKIKIKVFFPCPTVRVGVIDEDAEWSVLIKFKNFPRN